MFVKTVIRQGKLILDLYKENKELYKENQESRWDLSELENYKTQTQKLHKKIMIDLLNLQEINHLGIAEEEKNKHRNVIINNIIKELDVNKTY